MEHEGTEEFGHADVSVVDGRCRVALDGEISSEMRDRLDAVVAEVTALRRPVDVDLGAVTFLDSSGIGFLARLGIENPGEVHVLGARGLTRELLSLSGLSRVLTVDVAPEGTSDVR